MRKLSDWIPSFWPEYLVKIKVNIDAGFGQAVFITGDALGNWKHAQRLHCVSDHEWTINVRRPKLNNSEFKFLLGPHEAGDHPHVSQLSWLKGDNLKVTANDSYPGIEVTLTVDDFQADSHCNLAHRP